MTLLLYKLYIISMIFVHHLQNSHSERQTPIVMQFVQIHTFPMLS